MTDFDRTLPPVNILAGEIGQVVVNLVVNAAQAISEIGGRSGEKGTITISTRADGNFMEVQVHDTGPGIPEACRSRVFDGFFTTKPPDVGSGQGLSIVREIIVTQHGGTVDFETELGSGTTFLVRSNDGVFAGCPGMKHRILFIDDESRVLETLRRLLWNQRAVWEMEFLDSSLAAWDELLEKQYDVVLSDVRMPGLSGLQLLERIKQTKSMHDILVIMLTGESDRSLKRKALDLEATDLLNKALNSDELIARLRSALRLKTYQDELRCHNELLEQIDLVPSNFLRRKSTLFGDWARRVSFAMR